MRRLFHNHLLMSGVAVLFMATAEHVHGAAATPAPSTGNASTAVATYARTYYSHAAASPTPNASSSSAAVSATGSANSATAPIVQLVVSVPDQKLAVVVNGKIYKSYPISTSRYGEGDNWGSWRTPIGMLQIAGKIGGRAVAGSVFWRRQVTGEVLPANAPGRDPIVSRIIWLRGLEEGNRNAYKRCIYIHGTPQEAFLGRKASFGCIRMRSTDVIQVFDWVNIGTQVDIAEQPLSRAVKDLEQRATLIARYQPAPAVTRSEPAPGVAHNDTGRTTAAAASTNNSQPTISPLLKVGPPDPVAASSRKTASN
jgi:lipoprotein-anchoring transpeptidase ErfK/SrfK